MAEGQDARIKTLENDLEHALASVGAFRQAIETIFAKAEEHEIDQGGMIVTYVLPCGPLHRAIGLARGTDAGGKLLKRLSDTEAERDALTAERDADRAHLEGLQISYRNASDKAAQLGRALETATRSVDYWREAWEQKHIELEQAESERDALAARLAAAERESAEFSPWIAKMARTCRICDQVGLTGQIDHAPDCPFAALAAALEARE